MNYEYLAASDGSGEAVLANIEQNRIIGSNTLVVNSTDNYPAKFIGVTGDVNASGYITPSSMTQFYGRTEDGNVVIEGFLPGYTDKGNEKDQKLLVKQTSTWANELVRLAQVAHNPDGSLKSGLSWWEELGRTTVSSAGGLTISGVTPRKYMKLIYELSFSSQVTGIRAVLNGSNTYAGRSIDHFSGTVGSIVRDQDGFVVAEFVAQTWPNAGSGGELSLSFSNSLDRIIARSEVGVSTGTLTTSAQLIFCTAVTRVDIPLSSVNSIRLESTPKGLISRGSAVLLGHN